MNGKIVIMANSIAEAEKDLEMIKALSKNGIMCGCGGSLPCDCDCEDNDCDCGCEDCDGDGYGVGYEDGYNEGWADAKMAMLDALDG